MSIASWLKEYYPTPASNATKNDLVAAKHSLRKWQGYTPKALAKHQIKKPPAKTSQGSIILGSEGCALCRRHMHKYCNNCPIKEQTDRCTIFKEGLPYEAYLSNGDPFPMIKVLEECVERLETK